MVDKATTVPKAKFGKRTCRLSDRDTVRVNRALLLLPGLAG